MTMFPEVVAHRGWATRYPENTLEAFELVEQEQTLERAGIEFVDATQDSGAGVRWASPRGGPAEAPDRKLGS